MKENDVVYISKHDSIGIVTGKLCGLHEMYEVQMTEIFYVVFRKQDMKKIGRFD